jgi:hypothetical protein
LNAINPLHHALQASYEQLQKQQEILERIELQRRMKNLVVPTDPQEVKQLLRQLEEPVTLFGEREVSQAEFTGPPPADMLL